MLCIYLLLPHDINYSVFIILVIISRLKWNQFIIFLFSFIATQLIFAITDIATETLET